MNEEWLNNLEDSIEDFPDEVRDFIFGDELKEVKEDLGKQVTTEQQKLQLNNMLMFFLLQGKTEKELNDFIETLEVTDDQKLAIRAIIQEKIINELILIIEANNELAQESSGEKEGSVKNKNGYDSLADRLKQATIATSGKSDRVFNKNSSSGPGSISDTVPVRAIDPYHEAIDNE